MTLTDTTEQLAVPAVPALVITAYGTPGPQGSKNARPIYRGRGPGREFTGKVAQVESSKKVKPWREAVEAAALDQVAAAWPPARRELFPLACPLVAEFCFTLHRPKRPKHLVEHITYPDLSKLIRSTEDALTKAKVWADDALVVRMHNPRKVYVGSGDPDALDQPGAVIRVWTLDRAGAA